jgi:hypothetical protein
MLDAGMDTMVLDRKGRTPAEDTKDEAIRQMILDSRQASATSVAATPPAEKERAIIAGIPKLPAPVPSSPATQAAAAGDLASLQDMGVDELSCADESGNTPLIFASDAGREEVVQFLVCRGADVNFRGFLGANMHVVCLRISRVPLCCACCDCCHGCRCIYFVVVIVSVLVVAVV